MQVNYKTISSLEFDVLSGSYKQVEKQVEDTSSSSFSSLLEASSSTDNSSDPYSLSGKNYASEPDIMASLSFGGDSPSKNSFSNDFSTSLQAYKFRQDEQNILNKKEEGSSTNKSTLDDLLNQVS